MHLNRLLSGLNDERSRIRIWAWGLMLLATAFLICDITWRPIVIWDESRLAANALEMSRRGFSLITTYGFRPDLWNTKPPLLIWLEAESIRVFGPSEWAVRVPSLLAALATVGLVMQFAWRLGRSCFVAIAAPAMLLFSPGFFGAHAAHSGDYDTLLCLFTTAYLLLLFELLHSPRPDPWRVLLCGLLVTGACLTKGVAGVIPGVGVFVYALARGRWPRLFKTPWYALAGLIVVVLVGGYYGLREIASPGYLSAVVYEELSGRYLHGMNGHIQPAYYYIQYILQLFSLGPLLLLLLGAPFLIWKPTKSAAYLTYANFVSVALLLIYSFSRTKIFWYIIPVYPIVSIALAIVLNRLLKLLPRRPHQAVQLASLLAGVLALYMVGNGLLQKFVLLPRIENTPQGRYGEVFAQLDARGLRRVHTLDGGVYNDDGLIDYTPQRWFYTLVWNARGLDIRVQDPNQPVRLATGEVLVTCDPRYTEWVTARGPSLSTVPDCAAVAARPAQGG